MNAKTVEMIVRARRLDMDGKAMLLEALISLDALWHAQDIGDEAGEVRAAALRDEQMAKGSSLLRESEDLQRAAYDLDDEPGEPEAFRPKTSRETLAEMLGDEPEVIGGNLISAEFAKRWRHFRDLSLKSADLADQHTRDGTRESLDRCVAFQPMVKASFARLTALRPAYTESISPVEH